MFIGGHLLTTVRTRTCVPRAHVGEHQATEECISLNATLHSAVSEPAHFIAPHFRCGRTAAKPILDYEIHIDDENGIETHVVAAPISPLWPTYLHLGLSPSSTHTYKVRARNELGSGA